MSSFITIYLMACLFFAIFYAKDQVNKNDYDNKDKLSNGAIAVVYVIAVIVSTVLAPLIILEFMYKKTKKTLGEWKK